jgi:hypothetical protein
VVGLERVCDRFEKAVDCLIIVAPLLQLVASTGPQCWGVEGGKERPILGFGSEKVSKASKWFYRPVGERHLFIVLVFSENLERSLLEVEVIPGDAGSSTVVVARDSKNLSPTDTGIPDRVDQGVVSDLSNSISSLFIQGFAGALSNVSGNLHPLLWAPELLVASLSGRSIRERIAGNSCCCGVFIEDFPLPAVLEVRRDIVVVDIRGCGRNAGVPIS